MERRLLQRIRTSYHELDGIFTDKEAWGLFRISAFIETIGWILLVTGIVFSVNAWPGDSWLLPLAGSIHGICYLFYIFIVIFGHRSMNWSVWRFIVAGAVSTFPFGALIFEQWVAGQRNTSH